MTLQEPVACSRIEPMMCDYELKLFATHLSGQLMLASYATKLMLSKCEKSLLNKENKNKKHQNVIVRIQNVIIRHCALKNTSVEPVSLVLFQRFWFKVFTCFFHWLKSFCFAVFPLGCLLFRGPNSLTCYQMIWRNVGCIERGTHFPQNNSIQRLNMLDMKSIE